MEHDEELWDTLLRIIEYLKKVPTENMTFEEFSQYTRDRGIFIDFLMALRGMNLYEVKEENESESDSGKE